MTIADGTPAMPLPPAEPAMGVPAGPVVAGGPIAAPETAPLVKQDSSKYPRVKDFMEQTGLQRKVADDHCHATSDWYYIKHEGFNNISFRKGKDPKGPIVYTADVKAKIVGWSIVMRRADGSPVMSLKKEVTFARLLGWDKGTNVDIHHASESSLGSRNSPTLENLDSMKKRMLTRFKSTKKALQTKEKIEGEPKDGEIIVPDARDSEYSELDEKEVVELPAMKITSIHRKHAFRSNANEFIWEGRVYEWNYWIFLGSVLKLTDKATGDVLAEVQLMPTWRWQIITRWSWRLDGVLEIKDDAKRLGMQDIIVTTLTAMLEWRKHNNKVWIVAAAIA